MGDVDRWMMALVVSRVRPPGGRSVDGWMGGWLGRSIVDAQGGRPGGGSPAHRRVALLSAPRTHTPHPTPIQHTHTHTHAPDHHPPPVALTPALAHAAPPWPAPAAAAAGGQQGAAPRSLSLRALQGACSFDGLEETRLACSVRGGPRRLLLRAACGLMVKGCVSVCMYAPCVMGVLAPRARLSIEAASRMRQRTERNERGGGRESNNRNRSIPSPRPADCFPLNRSTDARVGGRVRSAARCHGAAKTQASRRHRAGAAGFSDERPNSQPQKAAPTSPPSTQAVPHSPPFALDSARIDKQTLASGSWRCPKTH